MDSICDHTDSSSSDSDSECDSQSLDCTESHEEIRFSGHTDDSDFCNKGNLDSYMSNAEQYLCIETTQPSEVESSYSPHTIPSLSLMQMYPSKGADQATTMLQFTFLPTTLPVISTQHKKETDLQNFLEYRYNTNSN